VESFHEGFETVAELADDLEEFLRTL